MPFERDRLRQRDDIGQEPRETPDLVISVDSLDFGNLMHNIFSATATHERASSNDAAKRYFFWQARHHLLVLCKFPLIRPPSFLRMDRQRPMIQCFPTARLDPLRTYSDCCCPGLP